MTHDFIQSRSKYIHNDNVLADSCQNVGLLTTNECITLPCTVWTCKKRTSDLSLDRFHSLTVIPFLDRFHSLTVVPLSNLCILKWQCTHPNCLIQLGDLMDARAEDCILPPIVYFHPLGYYFSDPVQSLPLYVPPLLPSPPSPRWMLTFFPPWFPDPQVQTI